MNYFVLERKHWYWTSDIGSELSQLVLRGIFCCSFAEISKGSNLTITQKKKKKKKISEQLAQLLNS